MTNFLDIMEYPGAEQNIGRDNHFLVISIDDLDMNITNGFQLLEQVRNYFMGANIIVLLSANYEQLEKICHNYYMKELEKVKGFKDTEEYVKLLSREYLEKIVPPQRQVAVPSGETWQFFNRKEVEVRYKNKGEEYKEEGTLEAIVQKDMKTYFRAGFLLGGKGLYYLTPNTLRELCTWIMRTRRLIVLEENSREAAWEENFQWFWNEEFPILCKRYLRTDDSRIFQTADLLEPERQVEYVRKYLRDKGVVDKSQGEISLLEMLSEFLQGDMQEQTLASIISIYFTVKIAEIITKMRWTQGKERNQVNQKFLNYFFNGVWGNWEKKMILPMFSQVEEEKVLFSIGYYTFKKSGKGLDINLKGNCVRDDLESIRSFLNSNKNMLRNYQYVLLFYRLKIKHKGKKREIWELDEKYVFRLIDECEGIFCFSNSFVSLISPFCLARQFIELLPDIIYTGTLDRVREKVATIVESEISIFNKGVKDSIIPLESIEFLIETGRSLQELLGNGKMEVLGKDSISGVVKEYFAIIQSHLKSYDETQEKVFMSHSFVKKIFSDDPAFFNMLATSILASSVPISFLIDGNEFDYEDWD